MGTVPSVLLGNCHCAIIDIETEPPKVPEPKKRQTSSKKTSTPSPSLKITDEDKKKFPYGMFPVKLIHMDGKDLQDKKTCYFQCEDHAKKYIDRCKFKKNQYHMFIKK